ncbi:hypothetical protein SAMD00019534_017050 [Acytostelium subglobosum LB1]|uniref:hypothetical protein n=1 Tax=Acytostelium subglobosum LB1 TaxID=1410327 RepID=UPI000644AEF4|nr:hypothetical protein SAMD00019534_017050 [Acytostelium subglobosum LB1]GAM18530.1 hypothetical protein SAMD00019534_017050 [Acytostelium subglobosum LB1]|eukprot:XP_012757750.1 hypothetical protein SAMD00019534_017050 [Acytostelium subglobosum LB1]
MSNYIGHDETNRIKRYDSVTQLTPYEYCCNKMEWVASTLRDSADCPSSASSLESLSIVTFNVWFDSYLWRQRATELFGIVEQRMPDVVCLQEVTPMFLDYLKEQRWVKEHYLMSDCGHSDTVFPYGVVILSRRDNVKFHLHSFTIYPLPTRQNRKLLTALFQLDSGALMSVSTVHLESLNSNSDMRIKQLQTIERITQERRQANQLECDSFLVGDLNFGASTMENQELTRLLYADMWREINANQEGVTCIKKKERVDRILHLRSSSSQSSVNISAEQSSISLLGTTSISLDHEARQAEQVGDNELVYPSDHFGLYGRFCCCC